jgi:WD40 repeat protein
VVFVLSHSRSVDLQLSRGLMTRPFEFGMQALALRCSHPFEVMMVALIPSHSRPMDAKLSRGLMTRPFECGMQAPVSRSSHPCEAMVTVFIGRDGSKIVSRFRVLDASTRVEMLPPLRGHHDSIRSVTSVAFSPDRSKIVSGSFDKTIRVWNVSTGVEMLSPLEGYNNYVRYVAISPDGSKIVSVSNDDILVWDPNTGVEVPCAQTEVDDISRSALNGAIIFLKEGWFTDINTGSCVGKLPVGASFYRWKAHRSTCIGWTRDHRLIIIRLLAR